MNTICKTTLLNVSTHCSHVALEIDQVFVVFACLPVVVPFVHSSCFRHIHPTNLHYHEVDNSDGVLQKDQSGHAMHVSMPKKEAIISV